MSKFKVGDRVRKNGNHNYLIYRKNEQDGLELTILKIEPSESTQYLKCFYGHNDWDWIADNDLELINNKTIMNIIEKAKLAFKGEPQKSFQKAGITDSSDNLTEEGTQVFLNWLLNKHGDDFKKEVVDVILAEEK